MRKPIPKSVRKQVYAKYNGHCAYCGCEIPEKGFNVDHLHCLRNYEYTEEFTGIDVHDISNLMPSCGSCNHYKATMDLETFRKQLHNIPDRLKRDVCTYNIAVRFGMVQENREPIKFYFEKVGEEMAIKPILFNTEMVRANLDGRKSCTRRIVKHDVEAILNSPYRKEHPEMEDKQIISKLCMPPYQPGDILYVRETWCGWYLPLVGMHYCYRATEPDGNKRPTSPEYDCDVEKILWRPSIHMPKEAARIWLKVTNVKVERLQDITSEQICKEGIEVEEPYVLNGEEKRYAFSIFWDSTIKKSDLDRYGWYASPWVWVIEYERCEKPEGV